uniref:Uncharacterized protein n=1 Tax=Mycena chlorophos TaxID=658473 RepID=A0ABQ0L201_MYCCL|nr:predicted protein [Mycena chlorophos]
MAIPTPEKNAEFAKLFDLFEMLATRRARKTPLTDADLDDTQTIPVPTELESVFKKLSPIVPPRSRRHTVSGVEAGHTAASEVVAEEDEDGSDQESMAKFPLGRMHAFTFRKMIHHLYQVDEWANKVRDVLQRSKIEYKSLVEQPVFVAESSSSPATPDGVTRVHFKAQVKIGGKKTVPLVLNRDGGRRRAHSIGSSRRNVALPTSPTRLGPNFINEGAADYLDPDATRAVKKRCIGRRKSSGALSGAIAPGEGWFYDSAVSSTERAESPALRNIANRPNANTRPRYQSLQGQQKQPPVVRRRIVSSGIKPPVPAPTNNIGAAMKRRFSEF